MQYKKDHTVKYGPEEMLPPAMYCNQGNKREALNRESSSAWFFKSWSSGSGTYLGLRQSLSVSIHSDPNRTVLSPSWWSRKRERLNQCWDHQKLKAERSPCMTDICWLPCISYNSRALRTRCFCHTSFCTANCCSGVSSEWLWLIFSMWELLACHPLKPHILSPRKGADIGI